MIVELILATLLFVLLPTSTGCPAANPSVQPPCSRHGADCSACLQQLSCGFCSIIPRPGDAGYLNFTPCMDIAQGPACCPRYPERWEVANSSLVSTNRGYPVHPSAATIQLVPGVPLTLEIEVSSPLTCGLVTDVMFLLDMSGTFRNAAQTLLGELPAIINDLERRYYRYPFAFCDRETVRIGLATFSETPLEPFGFQDGANNVNGEPATNSSGEPISWNWPNDWIGISQDANVVCPLRAGNFTDPGGRRRDGGPLNWKYCLEHPLSSNHTELKERLAALAEVAHSNLDSPQPVLDAMFYAARCAGWRQRSRKLAVVITNARYHGTSAEVCNATRCTIGGDPVDYVARGLFERQNDGDCLLDPPSSNWTSSYQQPAVNWSYDATRRFNRLPGAGENFVTKDVVSAALRSRGVVPVFLVVANTETSRPGDNQSNLRYYEELIDSWGFGFAKPLTLDPDPNLAYHISRVILEINKSVVLTVANSPNPVWSFQNLSNLTRNLDRRAYIIGIKPEARIFRNVLPGENFTFRVTFMVPPDVPVVGGYEIQLAVLGFGNCFITVTNQSQCRGCLGEPNWREDHCGVCNPCGVPTNCSRANCLPSSCLAANACPAPSSSPPIVIDVSDGPLSAPLPACSREFVCPQVNASRGLLVALEPQLSGCLWQALFTSVGGVLSVDVSALDSLADQEFCLHSSQTSEGQFTSIDVFGAACPVDASIVGSPSADDPGRTNWNLIFAGTTCTSARRWNLF